MMGGVAAPDPLLGGKIFFGPTHFGQHVETSIYIHEGLGEMRGETRFRFGSKADQPRIIPATSPQPLRNRFASFRISQGGARRQSSGDRPVSRARRGGSGTMEIRGGGFNFRSTGSLREKLRGLYTKPGISPGQMRQMSRFRFRGEKRFEGGGQGSRTPAPSLKLPPPTP